MMPQHRTVFQTDPPPYTVTAKPFLISRSIPTTEKPPGSAGESDPSEEDKSTTTTTTTTPPPPQFAVQGLFV